MTISDTPGEDDSHGYATRLLISLMEKHYPDRHPEWQPLPDLYGVLTQIDNLSTGLVRSDTAGPSDHAGLVAAAKPFVDYPVPRFAEDTNNVVCSFSAGEFRRLREAIAALSRAPEAVATIEDEFFYDPRTGRVAGDIPPAPQPALALIEELERALEAFADRVPPSARKQWRNALVAQAGIELGLFLDADAALASAKRFKEGA